MSAKKPRKTLKDPTALGFVYGEEPLKTEQSSPEPEKELEKTKDDQEEELEPVPTPSKATRKPRKQSEQTTGSFMSQIASKTVEKEPTVRITVDLPESLYQKLSVFCARTRTKKAEIIRGLLTEALQQLHD